MLEVPDPTVSVLPSMNSLFVFAATAMLLATPSAPAPLSVGFLLSTSIFTSSVASGTWPWLQFVAVFQSPFVAPVNWLSTACAGAAPTARVRIRAASPRL